MLNLETRKKRVVVSPQDNKFFKWDSGKFPGVYLVPGEPPHEIVARVKFAHKNNFPIYMVESDFSRVSDCHDILTFLSNVGFVYIFVDEVNNNRTQHSWMSFKIVDYVRDTDMSRYRQKSSRVKEYYNHLEKTGKKVAGKPYRFPTDYRFHPAWLTVTTKVTKAE